MLVPYAQAPRKTIQETIKFGHGDPMVSRAIRVFFRFETKRRTVSSLYNLLG